MNGKKYANILSYIIDGKNVAFTFLYNYDEKYFCKIINKKLNFYKI